MEHPGFAKSRFQCFHSSYITVHPLAWHAMKVPTMVRSRSRRLNESFVREREELQEKKLEVASLSENLVHEEYELDVKKVYDFRRVQ